MKHEYRHFADVKKKLRLVVCTRYTLPKTELSQDALALVTRRGVSTNSYKIYLSEFCTGQSFLLHELGHILCQHLRYESVIQQQVLSRVRGAWSHFKKYISFAKDGEPEALNALVHLLCNYAMDMEVNCTVFDADERSFLIEDMSRAEYKRLSYIAENLLPGAAAAHRCIERFEYARQQNPAAVLMKPVFAEDFGFERGLTWLKYIDLIILHPHTVMPLICEELRKRQEKLLPQGSKIPVAVIKRAADTADTADELTAEVSAAEDSCAHGKGSGHRASKTQSFTVKKLGPAVKSFITRRAVDEWSDMRTDYLYLANRGKATNVLRGKSVSHSDYTPGNIYVIVDTSGSVPEKHLARLLALFSDIRASVGERSKVIFWDTALQKVDSLHAGIESIPRGGGTDIAAAIAYAAKRYCTRDDRLFIISDYCDNLRSWLSEVHKLRCPCYGICWSIGPNGKRMQERFAHHFGLYDFCREVETFFVGFD